METAFWAKAHGATTHFPVALLLCSTVLDSAGFVFPRKRISGDLLAAGYWTMLFGAMGSICAVLTGLAMTRGSLFGAGALRHHHLFIWPAFALAIGLATWRVLNGRTAQRWVFGTYLVLAGSAAGLTLGAAYWGGEMLLAH